MSAAANLISLPAAKQKPTLQAKTAKVLLYGPPKIGKTTLAGGLDPDHTLFIATEPGHGALEAYVQPCDSWDAFRAIGASLAQDSASEQPRFHTIVIDTVDELLKQCTDAVMAKAGMTHPSDGEYGKGWGMVSDEFRLRIAKIASLGKGVWFISHSDDREIKQRVGTITKTVPTLSGKNRDFITGFVDFILLARAEQGADKDGQLVEHRVLRTQSTENYEAGGRITLPDPLPLDAAALKDAMNQALKA